ncbi:MAG: hypothetical protein IJR50_05175 [Treponema sp.]|nr:hypothetical protein [Treponema sp.]
MYAFLIIIIPTVLTYYFVASGERETVPVAFIGFIISVIVCAIKAFFSFSHHIFRANFLSNYAYIALAYSIVPIAVVYAVFIVFSGDTMKFRIKAYFPLLCAFFAVYIPYTTLAGSRTAYDVFELFFKPTLYALMLCLSSVCLRYGYCAYVDNDKKSDSIIWTTIFAASLLVPAAIETMWLIRLPFALWLILWCAYAFFASSSFICAMHDTATEKGFSIFLPWNIKKGAA